MSLSTEALMCFKGLLEQVQVQATDPALEEKTATILRVRRELEQALSEQQDPPIE